MLFIMLQPQDMLVLMGGAKAIDASAACLAAQHGIPVWVVVGPMQPPHGPGRHSPS